MLVHSPDSATSDHPRRCSPRVDLTVRGGRRSLHNQQQVSSTSGTLRGLTGHQIPLVRIHVSMLPCSGIGAAGHTSQLMICRPNLWSVITQTGTGKISDMILDGPEPDHATSKSTLSGRSLLVRSHQRHPAGWVTDVSLRTSSATRPIEAPSRLSSGTGTSRTPG